MSNDKHATLCLIVEIPADLPSAGAKGDSGPQTMCVRWCFVDQCEH